MTGPVPKPTHLRVLEGNPSRRPLNENEPQPKKIMPPCPKHLTPGARKQWKKLGRSLFDLGLLTEIDGDALALYCEAKARWIDAIQRLEKYPDVVLSPKSKFPVINPVFNIACASFEQMRKLLAEFGMTPSSRSRIGVKSKGAKDELEEMIR